MEILINAKQKDLFSLLVPYYFKGLNKLDVLLYQKICEEYVGEFELNIEQKNILANKLNKRTTVSSVANSIGRLSAAKAIVKISRGVYSINKKVIELGYFKNDIEIKISDGSI